MATTAEIDAALAELRALRRKLELADEEHADAIRFRDLGNVQLAAAVAARDAARAAVIAQKIVVHDLLAEVET